MLVERHILAFELYGRGKSGLPAHFIGAGINSQESPVPSAHSRESPGRPGDSLPGLFMGAASGLEVIPLVVSIIDSMY